MKEAIIRYKSNKTLDALKELGKYLGFSISNVPTKDSDKSPSINGVIVIEGDPSIDISKLSDVFTGKELNASELRKSGWQRKG